MLIFSLYILLGSVSGFLAGLLGIGGGIIIVPTLSFLFAYFNIVESSQVMHVTVGTTLAISIVSLTASIIVHYRHKAIEWSLLKRISPGIVIGSVLLGPPLVSHVNGQVLKILFAFFCFFVASQILLFRNSGVRTIEALNTVKLSFFGALTGLLSALLGVSGGVLMGAVLNYYRMNVHKIIGTTSAICIVAAVTSTCTLLILNYHDSGLPPLSTGYIYWPAFLSVALPSLITAPLGSQLTHRLPVKPLKKLFGVLVLVTGVKMLF